ncbi:hypothetical protein [Actinacidiphila sp. ITFR-21]|uniref:hypothetical protein n=1 Tax=Actinacidiphila sp. ITFR-21 TaxID=3075199 RepID=UPI002889EC2D|nr:hypothetical protein [Streptomyces sp. ITFR-21]WNI16953.1 hypothetical protein RLT57_16420 [Streptomyces sp. ITFR-21]
MTNTMNMIDTTSTTSTTSTAGPVGASTANAPRSTPATRRVKGGGTRTAWAARRVGRCRAVAEAGMSTAEYAVGIQFI